MSGKDGGWLLPEIIDPVTRKPVCICVPDEVNHAMAFWGALRDLGYWFNWQRDNDHTALPVSILWTQIIDEAHSKWLEGTMCTTCSELIECLQPLFDELNAKLDSIQGGVNNLQWGNGNNEPGQPLSPEELGENLSGGSNPGCNLDILWSQCLQLVQYTHQLVLDALEAAEAATNSSELVEVLSGLPGIDEVGADVIAGYIALLQDGISENYVGEYTATVEQQIACLIFCYCQSDCEITISAVNDVYNAKLGEFFADLPTSFITIADFMSYFVDQNIGSDAIVYALHYMIWAGGALANIFLGDIGTKSLETLLLLAANDPSSDWVVLCEDCPSDVWEQEFDFSINDGGWSLKPLLDGSTPVDFGVYATGDAWQGEYKTFNSPSTLGCVSIAINIPNAGTLSEMEVVWTGNVTTIQGTVQDRAILGANTLYSQSPTAKGTTGILAVRSVFVGTQSFDAGNELWVQWNYRRTFSNTADDGSIEINKIVLRGVGSNPFV